MCTALQTWHCNRKTIFFVVLACKSTKHVRPARHISTMNLLYPQANKVVRRQRYIDTESVSHCQTTVPFCGTLALSDLHILTASCRTAAFLQATSPLRHLCYCCNELSYWICWSRTIPCAYRLALPVLYCVTLCMVCFLQFLSLQKARLVLGTLTCKRIQEHRLKIHIQLHLGR